MKLHVELPKGILLDPSELDAFFAFLEGHQTVATESYKDENNAWQSRELLEDINTRMIYVKPMTDLHYNALKFFTDAQREAKANK